jgi:plastocyanin
LFERLVESLKRDVKPFLRFVSANYHNPTGRMGTEVNGKMNTNEKVILGLVAAAALVLSTGVVYAMSAQPLNRQVGYGGGMMGGAYSGGMMGGSTFRGVMGAYTDAGGMMGGSGGMMGTMAQYMGSFWNQPRQSGAGGFGDYVAMIGGAFYPSNLTIRAGATVTWMNMDFVQHTVTSGPEGASTGLFDSHELGHMQAFSFTFTTPGTYAYYCDIHPGMVGTVTVVA